MAAGATYEPIATTTLGADTSNITFSSISSSYTDLKLVVTAFQNSGGSVWLALQFNGDTATNYSFTRVYGNGTSAASSTTGTLAQMRTGFVYPSTTIPALCIANIFSYAGSTNKTVLSQVPNDANGAGQVNYSVGLWRSTSAITSIKILFEGGTNLLAGSTATLYGIKAA